MNTRLIRIGNSQGIILPKKLLQQYQLAGEVNLQPTPEGVLITSVTKLPRQGWDERFQHSAAQGQVPENELLEAFSDEVFEETEWQW
ncbi:AbrB/MazE/SpoVT family DNA-binding domain-containing protein [Hymenobacter lapidiphilus]|uniref:AbrB/MazE/SpoVT family DNA-binding domain-containing protein n=1 Tax=Hymenobacter lapidiphilus TaxID=2608003 RepID=A0A7Y7U6S0_9BACT|nr:AbrB/MazE/SpoVT family DNA-binding domain-containing protein [Hymenobacter lapidiphilus]NVO33106.1 AbrB/MazE/SpoVT family DNA-binding domain-containing protein [Hymenobacter lapidiphilus]